MRRDGRTPDQLRPIRFEVSYNKYAEGSVLVQFGQTHVLCNVTVDESLPPWLRNQAEPQGWVTAEYAMLPRSTAQRTPREQRWPKGRTQEISRLIGRSLRLAVDLKALGPRQFIVDCDVLQADGGTRTAAITGSWLALKLALQPFIEQGDVPPGVLKHQIAAVSVGIVRGAALLDLAYEEDLAADVDLNLVMTAGGEMVEIQGTAEKAPFTRPQLDALIGLADNGIQRLVSYQQEALASLQVGR
ncbi:MAG: ribonuclease PH [Chloroflexi bacterium]|nr:ribonuclease PH [Chloroflexota bacterium]MCI0579072.1 ribonuclease PH [Chloroflexota bacterium]MCI0649346.1 ribonuclease PH [Chloroflexota bacterium]MCI0730154.1 ribonuclease PH [Chloroflexota bacterium]